VKPIEVTTIVDVAVPTQEVIEPDKYQNYIVSTDSESAGRKFDFIALGENYKQQAKRQINFDVADEDSEQETLAERGGTAKQMSDGMIFSNALLDKYLIEPEYADLRKLVSRNLPRCRLFIYFNHVSAQINDQASFLLGQISVVPGKSAEVNALLGKLTQIKALAQDIDSFEKSAKQKKARFPWSFQNYRDLLELTDEELSKATKLQPLTRSQRRAIKVSVKIQQGLYEKQLEENNPNAEKTKLDVAKLQNFMSIIEPVDDSSKTSIRHPDEVSIDLEE